MSLVYIKGIPYTSSEATEKKYTYKDINKAVRIAGKWEEIPDWYVFESSPRGYMDKTPQLFTLVELNAEVAARTSRW